MLEKRATYNLIDIKPLNGPKFNDGNLSFYVDQGLVVDATEVANTILKIAETKESSEIKESSEEKHGDGDESPIFDLQAEISNHPDSLFIKCFAIKAEETNDNGDYFSGEELLKAVPTFVGVPLFTNHSNSDINEARGKVVHSWWDTERNGIMIIGRVDATAYPQLARGIKEDYVIGTSMGCFTPECRVLMYDGTYLPISEVQEGDKVYTHKGRVKEVLNSQIRYKDELLYEIKYEGFASSIKVTGNHPVWTLKEANLCACGCGKNLHKKESKRNQNWKTKYRKRFLNGHSQRIWNSNPDSKLHTTANKSLMQKSREYSFKDFEWKKIKDLKVGQVITMPVGGDEIETTLTESHAKLIGYFLAEGSFKKYDGIRREINFSFCYSLEKDTYAQEVQNLLKECFGENIPLWTQNRFPDNDVIIVCCHNPKIADWFYHFCGEYSSQKKMATEILFWPENLQKHIIGCFINGDGCVSTRNYKNREVNNPYTSASINTVSQKLAEQFSYILTKNKIWHTFRASHNSKSKELRLCVGAERLTINRTVKGVDCVFNVLPSYDLVINQNYLSKFLNYTGKKKTIYNVNKSFSDNDDMLISGPYLNRKITSIQPFVYTGPVYNLQVKDDNSYIVEGAAVKNCQVQYSLCSVCHNYAETPDQYCSCIQERKTRLVQSKAQECKYHNQGGEDKCPICQSTKKEKKKYAVNTKVFEYNYGIKFIENSFVVSPACADCGVTEVIDPSEFLAKVADIVKTLPRLLKAAETQPLMCSDKQCVKIAGQEQLDSLNQALDLISSVSQDMLNQKEQIDLEFLSDLVKVLADLQAVADELTEQGYGRLPSPGQPPTEGQGQEQIGQGGPEITNAVKPIKPSPGGGSKVTSGPAGQVGSVTSPLAAKIISLEKLSMNLLQRDKYITVPDFIIKKIKGIPQIKIADKPPNKQLNLAFQIPKAD